MAAPFGLDEADPAGKRRRPHLKQGWAEALLQPLASAPLSHAALLLLVFLAGVGWSSNRQALPDPLYEACDSVAVAAASTELRLPSQPGHTTARGKTLVVYVYGGSDPRELG